MFSIDETQLIAIVIAIACAIPGVFMVLRRHSMMADSISHSVLLGIVIAFMFTHDLSSPLLLIGAAIAGIITVWLTELIIKSRLVSDDSGIGLVFPLMFSIGVILIVNQLGNAHLCANHIIEGEILFATGDPVIVFGHYLGTSALWTSIGLAALNILVATLFFKEFKLATFDPMLAATLGLSPVIMHYALMSMVAVTAVGSFQYVGSILVIALMIGPAVTSYLLTSNLKIMLILSCIIAACNSILGYMAADALDVSVAGSIAVMTGISFLVVLIISPKHGLISTLSRQRRNRIEFAKAMLLFHLHHHENTPAEHEESGENSIAKHLNWTPEFTNKIIQLLKNEGKILYPTIKLTEQGRQQRITNQQNFFYS